MEQAFESQSPYQQLQTINNALSSGMYVHVRKMLHHMPAPDVAFLLESTPLKAVRYYGN